MRHAKSRPRKQNLKITNFASKFIIKNKVKKKHDTLHNQYYKRYGKLAKEK